MPVTALVAAQELLTHLQEECAKARTREDPQHVEACETSLNLCEKSSRRLKF